MRTTRNGGKGNKKKKKCLLAIMLCLCVALSGMDTGAFATTLLQTDTGLCEHHKEHTTECGFVTDRQEVPCNKECIDQDGDGKIDHQEGCDYDPGKQPCQYNCELCNDSSIDPMIEDNNEIESTPDNEKTFEKTAARKSGKINTKSIDEAELRNHVLTEGVVDPDNTVVNLFDYWVNEDAETPVSGDILKNKHRHQRQNKGPANFSGEASWNEGINKNHLLIFGDGIIHAGLWNKGAGSGTDYGKKYAGTEKIVKSTLSENGYPIINTEDADKQLTQDRDHTLIEDYRLAGDHVSGNENDGDESYAGNSIQNISNTVLNNWGKNVKTDTESLDYLFNPDNDHSYKKSYKDVKGLFQLGTDGYYSYNMRKNFAEFDEDSNSFKLYDRAATIRTDGDDSSIGNFLPFNKGKEVFESDGNGGLKNDIVDLRKPVTSGTMNHHMGMTISTDFRQPVNGQINAGTGGTNPMTFEFAGDDDVWVFIDDVLVLDLGGVHSEIYGTIDFSNGNVCIGRAFNAKGIPENPEDPANLVTKTNLKELYAAADQGDKINWKGNTFASNSYHTLKMFYLERGNYDSSIALRFNLQPQLYQQIKKVDQNGNPVKGVAFDLYEAEKKGDTYTQVGSPLLSLTSDEKGIAQFKDSEGHPFNFVDRSPGLNDRTYYILKEKNTPPGYRSIPIDPILQFDPATTMLTVVNRWSTGAYASFVSNIEGTGEVTYGSYDANTGNINVSNDKVNRTSQRDGLVVAVPMLKNQGSGKWMPLYGDNTNGFHTVQYGESASVVEIRKAVLTSALLQSSLYALDTSEHAKVPGWYIPYNTKTQRLEGSISDLPGMANRYQLNNPENADMRMVYAVIEPDALEKWGIRGESSENRYAALGNRLSKNGTLESDADLRAEAEALINGITIEGDPGARDFSLLNVDQFSRNFRSLIYIPNEQRQLRIIKVDQDGKRTGGAEFSLFTDKACKGEPVSKGITDKNGELIFSPDGTKEGKAGEAEMIWASSTNTEYYLKETKAPANYRINETVTPIHVGIYSIYADAGDKDNGIKVMAGVGKLAQTMSKYASDGEVNISLRDIVAYAQHQDAGSFDLHGWKDTKLENSSRNRSMNLHYGLNAVVDYGLHDEDGGKTIQPFFVTDTGFIRTRVEQNHNRGQYLHDSTYNSAANWEQIDGDITGLFSLLNIVVVTDKTDAGTDTGQLTISKKIEGTGLADTDYSRNFDMKVTLKDANGKELEGNYYFYGNDKSGYVSSGGTIPLHHDESITILGLPQGTHYTVVEETANKDGFYSRPAFGSASGIIIRDEVATAAFVNTKMDENPKLGDLMIQKTVTGQGASQERYFDFAIRLFDKDGTPLKGSYSYIGSKVGVIQDGGTFKLKHNENILITGLPLGVTFQITEVQTNGYVASKEGDKGSIISDAQATAKFVNTWTDPVPDVPDPDPDPGKKDDPELDIEKSQSVNNGKETKQRQNVKNGDMVTYYVTVRNSSKKTAKDVVVTDTVPKGLRLVAGSISDNGIEKNDVITWKIGDLGAGKSKKVSFQVTVPNVTRATTWINIAATTYSNNPDGKDTARLSNEVQIGTDPAGVVKTGDSSGYRNLALLALIAFAVMVMLGLEALLRKKSTILHR